VPGWHEATRDLQEAGRLAVAGIIEEQHPDRCRLFMQWKGMDWPVMVDPLNLLGVEVVPHTYILDGEGVIRMCPLKLEQDESLRDQEATASVRDAVDPGPGGPPDQSSGLAGRARRDPEQLHPDRRGAGSRGAEEAPGQWKRYADALLLWGGPETLDRAIESYRRVLVLKPGSSDGPAHFALGVAYRKRYDSPLRRPGDFQQAVAHWKRALDRDPNQYIWRRRIQQYGPRLDKPYAFYDWVNRARAEIRARGEDPLPLLVEPRGSEFAERREELPTGGREQEPDPGARVRRDPGELIAVEATAVPPVVEPGEAAMIHLTLAPRADGLAHWNNEAAALTVWAQPPAGWQVEQRLLSVPNPSSLESTEVRRLELEVRAPEQAASGGVTIEAYALYYVCEEEGGACLFRRQDIGVPLELRGRG
jgi:hypothetical protein